MGWVFKYLIGRFVGYWLGCTFEFAGWLGCDSGLVVRVVCGCYFGTCLVLGGSLGCGVSGFAIAGLRLISCRLMQVVGCFV